MKAALVLCCCAVLLPAVAARAQRHAAGCGPYSVKFATHLPTRGAWPGPVAGKALVYFDEDNSGASSLSPPTTRIGIDGKWVGAMQEVSWFYTYVTPGSHTLCANWQTSWVPGWRATTQTDVFTAKAGGVYYFEAKYDEYGGQTSMRLHELDKERGNLIVTRKYFYCTSHPEASGHPRK